MLCVDGESKMERSGGASREDDEEEWVRVSDRGRQKDRKRKTKGPTEGDRRTDERTLIALCKLFKTNILKLQPLLAKLSSTKVLPGGTDDFDYIHPRPGSIDD